MVSVLPSTTVVSFTFIEPAPTAAKKAKFIPTRSRRMTSRMQVTINRRNRPPGLRHGGPNGGPNCGPKGGPPGPPPNPRDGIPGGGGGDQPPAPCGGGGGVNAG